MIIVTKFDIGDKVRVIETGREGQIRTFKFEATKKEDNQLIQVPKYLVHFNSYDFKWVEEHELKEYHQYEFENKFELKLINELIDIYLKEGKFDLVKILHDQKSLYKG